jgi:hypothetical protein
MKAILAIICITALEIVALTQGINGAYLSISVGAIAGLGGYSLNQLRLKRKGNGKPPSAD